MDDSSTTSSNASNIPIEDLSKDELINKYNNIINKYKALLTIAKKAKEAKDEKAEENRKLREELKEQKDADKRALLTMQKIVEELTAKLDDVQKKNGNDDAALNELSIENESLRRQLSRLNEDNESLLNEIERMENQLKQVSSEQKKHLELLETEVNRLKEVESNSFSLQNQIAVSLAENKAIKEQENATKKALEDLQKKYQNLKTNNTTQKEKFSSLKERFVDVYRKLKKVKECKRILLETQHEYSEAVTKWQKEIMKASTVLCNQMNTLKKENEELLAQLLLLQTTQGDRKNTTTPLDVNHVITKLKEVDELASTILREMKLKGIEFNKDDNICESTHLELGKMNETLVEPLIAPKDNPQGAESEEQQNKIIDNEVNHLTLENQNSELKHTLNELQSKHHNLEDSFHRQQIEIKTYREEIENIQKAMEAHKLEVQKLTEIIKEKTNECNQLHAEVKELRIKEEFLLECQAQIEKLRENHENAREQHELKTKDALNEMQENYELLLTKYKVKESEHTDLLDEMRELNEALKARGDVISRQEEAHQELVSELKKNNAKLKQFEDHLLEKEQLFNAKETEVLQINREIYEARQKISELEAASTEREKRIASLSTELDSIRNAERPQQMGGRENANDDAQSDALSTVSMRTEDMQKRLSELDDGLEERYNKLRNLAAKLKKKLQEQIAHNTELESQVNGMETIKQELNEYKEKVTALEEQRKLNEALQAENKKLKSNRKQTNVLNLEIEAAEKSLSEVSAKLNAKIDELEALNSVLATKEGTIVQLRKEIAILEGARADEYKHSKELKNQIDLLQNQIKEALHAKQTTFVLNKELEQREEKLKSEIEELRLELAKIEGKHTMSLEKLKADHDMMQTKLQETETLLQSTQGQLRSAERSLDELRSEYLEYKVKAQTVLSRKNQNKESSKEHQLNEELLELQSMKTKLESNINALNVRLDETLKDNEFLKGNNRELQCQNAELLKLVEDLRQQADLISQENRTQLQTQQESLRQQSQQIEAIESLHAVQLKSLEANYKHQIDELKIELAKLSATYVDISGDKHRKTHVSTFMERGDAEGSEEANVSLAAAAAQRKISTTSSLGSGQPRNATNVGFMPLDELLNTPISTLSSETIINNNSNADSRLSSDSVDNSLKDHDNVEHLRLELQQAKDRLQVQETRARHLTALLAENEQDLARLTQMNDKFKEELRRYERSEERQQEMHNSEYLKNVIMKFITLNSVDERTRLVPVLNTILRLSRSEAEMLNCVAKGQKVSDSGGRSWSNFLPSWGSSNNNNNNTTT